MKQLEQHIFAERIWWKRIANKDQKQTIKDNLLRDLKSKASLDNLTIDMGTIEFKEELIKERNCDDKWKISVTGTAVEDLKKNVVKRKPIKKK